VDKTSRRRVTAKGQVRAIIRRLIRCLLPRAPEPRARWSHRWLLDVGTLCVKEGRTWVYLPVDDFQLLCLHRWLNENKGMVRATLDLGNGNSATVAGRTLRELRLVVQGAAEEACARIATEMRYTADIDACIAHLETSSKEEGV
jgi:hypothetical protein